MASVNIPAHGTQPDFVQNGFRNINIDAGMLCNTAGGFADYFSDKGQDTPDGHIIRLHVFIGYWIHLVVLNDPKAAAVKFTAVQFGIVGTDVDFSVHGPVHCNITVSQFGDNTAQASCIECLVSPDGLRLNCFSRCMA